MKRSLAWAVGLALVAAAAWADSRITALDGTSWTLQVSPDGLAKEKGEKEYQESLSFQAGRIETTQAGQRGFEAAPYVVSRSGEKDWSFEASQKSASQGSFAWSGTAHGDDIRGKIVWTKPDRTALTYTFHGDRKK